MADQPELTVADAAAAWRSWLAANHADPTGVWLGADSDAAGADSGADSGADG